MAVHAKRHSTLTLLVRDGNHFMPAATSELEWRLADPAGLLWLDIEGPTADDIDLLEGVFHFHPLAVEDTLSEHHEPSKIEDYGNYLFLIVHGFDFDVRTEDVWTQELDIFVGSNYVVTSHHQQLRVIDEVVKRCERNAPLLTRGSDWLTHALLDTLVDDLLPVVDRIDEEISRLQDLALTNPPPGMVNRMTRLKNSAIRLRRLVTPQRDIVNKIARGDFSHLIQPETQWYYRDVYDHLVRVADMIEGLRDLGDDVISTYLATISNRLNEIVKIMTGVSVIFLPLTLIASIFGTNFGNTYEFTSWVGFLSMLGGMLAIALILYAWFRRQHWF